MNLLDTFKNQTPNNIVLEQFVKEATDYLDSVATINNRPITEQRF